MDKIEQLVEALVSRKDTVRADNVEDAVKAMERLRDMGHAQWFRGQIRNWPKLVPTVYRDSVDFNEALSELNRFFYWAKNEPGLEKIAQSTDALIAVAQHYGLPTSFLDFTTNPRVAGYFASASKEPPPHGDESCIYYLNTEEADDIWGYLPKDGNPIPERLVLDVTNLWRLEAQEGVFVFCPSANLNWIYPIDRIVFPYQGPIDFPLDADIYPERESPLEARLREYFEGEKNRRGGKEFKRLWGIPAHIIPEENRLHITAELYKPEEFVTTPTAHESWADDALEPWCNLRREYWREVQRTPSLVYAVNSAGPIEAETEKFGKYVLNAFAGNPTIRQKLVLWSITIDQYDNANVDQINKAVQRVWDEMTRLPWSDDDIAHALAETLRFSLWVEYVRGRKELSDYQLVQEAVQRLFQKPFWIEFGPEGDSYSRAWVNESDLLGAVREDFESMLRPEERRNIVGHGINTLLSARSPSLLFDFQKLSQLFPAQIIPSQAVFYPEKPLHATPARLHILGPT